MPYYTLIGRDGTDSQAPERRQHARTAHLEGMKALKAAGHLLMAAALTNEAGAMVGSVLTLSFPDEAALNDWLETEPYLLDDVWKSVEVMHCQVAPLFLNP